MSKETANKSRPSFRELQAKIENLKGKRDDLNKKTKEFINGLQEIDTEINESLRTAKDKFKKKRDYWNDKVKKLKAKKIEYKNLFDNLIQEKKKLQKTKGSGKGSKQFISIKQLDRKIDNLERIIETENLDIAEENDIIDQIRELTETKHDFLEEQENTDFFKFERKIEIVKINLNKIYEQLSKWSNKSQDYHSKMLEIYDNVSSLKAKKAKMEEALIENKKAADNFHAQYLQVMNQKKKISKGRGGKKNRSPRGKPNHRPTRHYGKNNALLEKMKQEKLATALEKQKAGKKLNLFEARLILEQK